jgi:osmotically-inducible protein OsmY
MPPVGSSFMAQASSSPQNPSTSPAGSGQSGTANPTAPTETQTNPTSAPTQPSAGSADAQSNIQKALQQDPTLANQNISVTVSGNKVELTGTVASKEQKKTAKQIAETNAGGMKVVDHLKVESKGNPPQKY